MKRFFTAFFITAAVLIAGVLAFGFVFRGSLFVKQAATASGPTSRQNSSLPVKPTSSGAGNLPASWDDGGIFSAYYEKTYQKLLTMSLEQKIGQILLARCPSSGAVDSIAEYHPSGFVLFDQDFKDKTAAQVKATINSYQAASTIPMIMSVDEEGGTIVRISSNPKLAKSKFKSPMQIYAEGGLKAIRVDTEQKATLLKKLGLNLNLAPVSDVSQDPSDYIYQRTLGKGAKETGTYVAEVVQVMNAAGLSTTLKHFPGYGNNVNTHTGISIDRRPYKDFVGSDFIPFENGIAAGAESILVSHNIVECMDEGVPASLSPKVHSILRNDLHFTGLIMTDDLSMDAIKYYTHNSNPVIQAVLAGNDLLLTSDIEESYESVLTAVKAGTIPQTAIDKAVFRVLAFKYARGIIN